MTGLSRGGGATRVVRAVQQRTDTCRARRPAGAADAPTDWVSGQTQAFTGVGTSLPGDKFDADNFGRGKFRHL